MRYLVPFGLGIAALVAMGAARLSSRAHRGSRKEANGPFSGEADRAVGRRRSKQ
jgi:hypothetical protein